MPDYRDTSASSLGSRLGSLVHDSDCALPSLSSITGTIAVELEKSATLGVILLRADVLGRAVQLFPWSEMAEMYAALAHAVNSLVGAHLRRIDLPADLGLAGDAVVVVLSAPREAQGVTLEQVESVVSRLKAGVDTVLVGRLSPALVERLAVDVGSSLLDRPSGGHTVEEQLFAALTLADEAATLSCTRRVAAEGKSLGGLLDSGALRVEYQQVVRALDFSLVGFEAVLRGQAGTRLAHSDVLLDVAQRVGLRGRVCDLLYRQALLGLAGEVVRDELLILGVSAEDLLVTAIGLMQELYQPRETRLTPANVLFLTDSTSVFTRFPCSLAAFQSVADMGFRLGLDAVFDTPFPLEYVRELRPDLIRLRGRGVSTLYERPDEFDQVSVLTRFAARHSMKVLVSGCREVGDLEALRRADVDLIQGELIGGFTGTPDRTLERPV